MRQTASMLNSREGLRIAAPQHTPDVTKIAYIVQCGHAEFLRARKSPVQLGAETCKKIQSHACSASVLKTVRLFLVTKIDVMMGSMQIAWTGISSQRDRHGHALRPLSAETQTGKIVERIILQCPPGCSHKRANFIDRVLVDDRQRLRPPSDEELSAGL